MGDVIAYRAPAHSELREIIRTINLTRCVGSSLPFEGWKRNAAPYPRTLNILTLKRASYAIA